ncbi:hypothetical protein LCGC14_1843740 [marine sediment metagenome]|uniref:Zeta toxin domain-containing protein n=1 Tax=marine sediment metagenome TaxID=412755 RepID=A0A0F9GCL2_9ZZZZ
MNRLILTVGLPLSGKTTWALEQGWPIVNPDSIRLALHGMPYKQVAEPFVWAIAKCMVRALFLAGHGVVILDATNVTKKRRDDWESDHWQREARVFRATKEECLQRAAAIGRDDLFSMIERMAEAWDFDGADDFPDGSAG